MTGPANFDQHIEDYGVKAVAEALDDARKAAVVYARKLEEYKRAVAYAELNTALNEAP